MDIFGGKLGVLADLSRDLEVELSQISWKGAEAREQDPFLDVWKVFVDHISLIRWIGQFLIFLRKWRFDDKGFLLLIFSLFHRLISRASVGGILDGRDPEALVSSDEALFLRRASVLKPYSLVRGV